MANVYEIVFTGRPAEGKPVDILDESKQVADSAELALVKATLDCCDSLVVGDEGDIVPDLAVAIRPFGK